MEQQVTQEKAGTLLGLTARQIRRLIQRVRQEEDQGLVHRRRGKPSNRPIAERLRAKVLHLYEKRNGDFGPTLAAEKLAERHGITISAETLQRWLQERELDLLVALEHSRDQYAWVHWYRPEGLRLLAGLEVLSEAAMTQGP